MSRIPCARICLGCSAQNCESCSVLREYLKQAPFVSAYLDDFKKDCDLENHFASGL